MATGSPFTGNEPTLGPGGSKIWNLTPAAQHPGEDEAVDALVAGPGWRLERIVSQGHTAPANPAEWYDQDEDEWVVVVTGSARLTVAEEGTTAADIELGPGDAVWLPAHCRHRVAWTDPATPTVWLALFADPQSAGG